MQVGANFHREKKIMATKKATTLAKYALTIGAGFSGGYFYRNFALDDYLIKPPTFANLEPRPRPKSFDYEWGPVTKWDANWDQRHYKETKPKATRHLLLIRHGQYNLKGKTDEERFLTDLGREQAALTGRRLAELNLPYSSLVSSSMTRAQQTSGLIRQNLPENLFVKPDDPILVEGAPYPPEPRSRWNPESSYFSDGCRIEAAFRKYFHRADVQQEQDSFEVIVCHANVIRYFICRALQLPPEAWLRMSLKHASITWVSIRPNGNVSARAIGDGGHMPPEKLTTM